MSDLHSLHASQFTDMEASRLGDGFDTNIEGADELDRIRSAVEEARWQGEVYVREQQDAIRESCIKQRENSRLAKRHSEARQEALELAVKLEAMRAADAGASAREAELHIVKQRCDLLQRTASEWRETLDRKSQECARWRHRATAKHVSKVPDDEELLDSIPSSPQALGCGVRAVSSQVPTLDWHSLLASANGSPVRGVPHEHGYLADVPTPTRIAHPTAGLSAAAQLREPSNRMSLPLWLGDRSQDAAGGFAAQSQHTSSRESAQEWLSAALHAARAWAAAEMSVASGTAPSIDPNSGLGLALTEAENELEMLTFLLEDGASMEAEMLAEQEAIHQSPLVVKRLREYLHELAKRRRSRATA
jgi:hypothetical protein